jgi:isopenicillin-N epimerase
MLTRRELSGAIHTPAGAALALTHIDRRAFAAVRNALESHAGSAEETAADETLWRPVQRAFPVDRSIINLNNAGVSPSSSAVLAAEERFVARSNAAPAHTMWRELEPQREKVRQALATLFGCDAEEIAITRNASEGLETCQLGFDLKAGDEVLTSNQDYPRMLWTFRQMEQRSGIVLRLVSLPTPPEEPAEVVARFAAAITPRTRMILVSHMINLTGNVLPAREVVALGRQRGIPVVVDGAHSFGHLCFRQPDLDCDYFATSLHKWLAAPHGTGMLYVRRDKVRSLWPLMPPPPGMEDNIRKFEEIGTHPAAPALAIADALTLHQAIGGERKLARLCHLRDRWARALLQHDRVALHTSLKPGFSGAIATVQVTGIASTALADHLWDAHRIVVAAIDHPELTGIRVSPSLYTTIQEVDRFADVMEKIIRHGLPGK